MTEEPRQTTARQLTRRELLRTGTLVAGGLVVAKESLCAQPAAPAVHRPLPAQRRFTSRSVERAIDEVTHAIPNRKLATLFENCFPNTLDTTVFPGTIGGQPDTFVITGDIDAMWLRDSSAQVWPYVSLAREDPELARLLQGVIRRQTRSILLDPYANAFMRDASAQPLSWAVHDGTDMHPGVGERKWEIDSLCWPLRLSYGYWKKTGDASPFDHVWQNAMRKVVATFREQQRKSGPGPYHFQRETKVPTDTLMLSGYGNPARANGMIFSMFRPSDDACLYPLFVPANFFAVVSLHQLAEIASGVLRDGSLSNEANALATETEGALTLHGRIQHSRYGEIWAYEVDGYGNHVAMDDANAPGLLSLPYLGCCAKSDPLYRRTRAFVLSTDNPYFFRGKAAEGIGGPHVGLDMIWPMSIVMRALTSTDDEEIVQCLRWLISTDADTGFMHEAFNKDDPARFTRPWFAWANTLFGELVLTLYRERPNLLRQA